MSVTRSSREPPGRPSRGRDEPARPGASLIDPQTLMRIKSLQIRARVAVEGFIKGIHRSPYHGFSVEFSEYREYSPGDDPRYLDWRLYARSDRYYVKRFEDETNLRCYLVVDTSRSMGYRSGSYSKSDYARTAAATIAYFLSTQRDAVGLLTFEDRITEYLPARYRPGHLRRLMAALEREPTGRATDLVEPLEADRRDGAQARADHPDLRPAGADRLAADPARIPALARARRRRPAGPRPGGGAISRSRRRRCFTTWNRAGRSTSTRARRGEEYLRRFAAHAAEIERSCVDLGIEYEPITTDRPLELVLFDLLKARMRRGRRPGRRIAPGRGGAR